MHIADSVSAMLVCSMAVANTPTNSFDRGFTLNDRANGQQQSKPKSIEPWLRWSTAIVALRVSVDQEVDEPPRIGLTNKTSYQKRDAEDKTCVNKVVIINGPEYNRARGGKKDTSEGKGQHVIQGRDDDANVFQHSEWLSEVV